MIGNNVILRIAKEVSSDVRQYHAMSTIADKVIIASEGARK